MTPRLQKPFLYPRTNLLLVCLIATVLALDSI